MIWAKGKPCLCQRGHSGLSHVPINLFLLPQLPHHHSEVTARPIHWASRNKSHNETAFHFWYSKILLLEFCLISYPHQQDSSPLGKVLLCFTSCCELWCLANWICCCCLVTNLCPTLCSPMDYSLPGSSVHGIFQARILEWVPKDQTCVFCKGRWILYHYTNWIGGVWN